MTAEGDAGAIQDVSETLITVLEDGIETFEVDVVLSSPDSVTTAGSPTLGLFLYDVEENPHENTLQPEEVDAGTVRPPPVVVDLNYMVTAYPSGTDGESEKTKRAHSLLGEAMWALRDAAIVRGTTLSGSLEGELRVSKADDEDLLMDIWNTFPDTAYLPSVPYTVGPVALAGGEPEAAGRVETLTRLGDDSDG